MTRLPLVIHERLGVWARQLRPRLSSWPVRVVESRSIADLAAAVRLWAAPLVIIDVGKRPRAALEALEATLAAAPAALVLLIDPLCHTEMPLLARELGATHVLTRPVTPPIVSGLLAHWIPLALRRSESEGWSAQDGVDDVWNPAVLRPSQSELPRLSAS